MKTNDVNISDGSQCDLAAGVLKQAAQDLRRLRGATSTVEQELYLDAYRWLAADECLWPFSFLNVCQLLNLSPENVRQELIGGLSLGGFTHRARRCQRAASQLRASFRQLFVREALREREHASGIWRGKKHGLSQRCLRGWIMLT